MKGYGKDKACTAAAAAAAVGLYHRACISVCLLARKSGAAVGTCEHSRSQCLVRYLICHDDWSGHRSSPNALPHSKKSCHASNGCGAGERGRGWEGCVVEQPRVLPLCLSASLSIASAISSPFRSRFLLSSLFIKCSFCPSLAALHCCSCQFCLSPLDGVSRAAAPH